MRIIIDFQGAQTGSRYRGIGHYSTEFVKSIIRRCPQDEFFLVLNGLIPEPIELIRAEFEDYLPQQNIRVWYTPGPIEHFGDSAGNLRETAEAMREFFLRSLEPDLIIITSMFEGLGDNAVVTAKKFVKDVPVAAIFYDFTPLYMPDENFRKNPVYRRWYRERIANLQECDLLFSISESSRQEIIKQGVAPPERVVNVFGGRNEAFQPRTYTLDERAEILRSFGITKPYIMYAGGIEPNKNLKRLIEALSDLPPELCDSYQFVCVGKRNPGETAKILSFARDSAALDMIRIIDFVTQTELIDLYNLCELFVFPSLREGFGLPPLEAMACGAPTIVSDRTSLPELVKNADALFDPESRESISGKIMEVLTNRRFRDSLIKRGLERARELSWDATGSTAAAVLQTRISAHQGFDESRRAVLSHTTLFKPNYKRIIVQKLDHHGDFLLGLPAMTKLRARYPHARIEALVGSWNRQAAEASGLFDEIHTLDYFKASSSLRPQLDDELFNELIERLPIYDYAIDLRRQTDTRFLLLRLNAHHYFGYKTGDEEIDHLLTRPLDLHPDVGGQRSYFDETHTCEQMLRIIDALPFNPNDYLHLPEFGVKGPAKEGAIAIFPKVGNDSRQWSSHYFDSLIRVLVAEAAITEINVFCGREEELKDLRFQRSGKVHVHAGLSFAKLYSALSRNRVCVGNNSFGVHLAGYAGCKTIGIYSGHELPQQWGPPFGDSLAITVDPPCAPCHLPDRQSCPFDLFCLNDISVETVKAAILDAMAGKPMPEHYSRIRRANPASVVKPLIDAVNKSKFAGRIDGLSPENRIALAAAISVNFPERASEQRCIFLDVSGILVPEILARSNRRFREVHEIINYLRQSIDGNVVPIATGPHDHEFYLVDLRNLEESLFKSSRFERVVRPLAGDVYVGLHSYLNRNPAQWNLLSTWRQNGVFVIFGVPEGVDSAFLKCDAVQDRALASYLFTVSHFDAILAPDQDCADLREWIGEFGPPRFREILCGRDLLDLIPPTHNSSPSADSLAPSKRSIRPSRRPQKRAREQESDGGPLRKRELT
jgi:glycosyltransferase involved in cell wall biosynthesis/ADP-heptose:LPS heptosyltransferase